MPAGQHPLRRLFWITESWPGDLFSFWLLIHCQQTFTFSFAQEFPGDGFGAKALKVAKITKAMLRLSTLSSHSSSSFLPDLHRLDDKPETSCGAHARDKTIRVDKAG